MNVVRILYTMHVYICIVFSVFETEEVIISPNCLKRWNHWCNQISVLSIQSNERLFIKCVIPMEDRENQMEKNEKISK